MTDPAPSIDPTPADPANPDPAPTDPTPDPAPADPSGADDKRVQRANAEAARYRTERNTLQDQITQQGATLDALRKALDPNGDTSADPAAQLPELTGRVETLTSENASLKAELLVHTLAGDGGGNPVALLDSRSFLKTLQGLDPEAEDYRDQVAAAIKAAVKDNASLAAVGQVPSRGGAPDAGQGSAAPGSVTQEQFDGMSIGQRQELYRTNPDLYRRLADSIR